MKKGDEGVADAKKYQQDLLNLYDEWLINFPEYRGRKIVGEIISNKAQVMVDYKLASNQEIYNIFNKSFNNDYGNKDSLVNIVHQKLDLSNSSESSSNFWAKIGSIFKKPKNIVTRYMI